MTTESAKCPNCGKPVSPHALMAMCPDCLLKAGFATEADGTNTGEAAAFAPPAPEELAPHFPQLEILHCIGRGGMGVVYKARQKSLDRFVALKLLAPERVGDPVFAGRFAREAQALAKLNHPNIVTVHDFGEAGGFFYLLMEFVDGVNLRQAMKAGRFTPEQALAIVPPICEALQYAHDHGIVHRDIKPENLLLDREGRVMIADFGIAKMLGAEASTAPNESQPAGTPQYMAPEQREHGVTDHRVDIYALGVVLYELLTGELPATRLQPPSQKVQIDVRLDEIVLRALQAEPELRFQTAAEFRTQIETVAHAAAAGLPPLGCSPQPPTWDSTRTESIRQEIKAPARGLLVAGVINFCALALSIAAILICMRSQGIAPGSFRFQPYASKAGLAGAGIEGLMILGAVVLILIGASRMRRLQTYGLAVTASILALITPPFFPGLAFGIWCLVVLARRDVRAAFFETTRPSTHTDAVPQGNSSQSSTDGQRTPANARLAWLAIFFAGLSGLLGTAAFALLPKTSVMLDGLILVAALLGVQLGIQTRMTRRGKTAIVVGAINTAIALGVAIVFNLLQGPAKTDFGPVVEKAVPEAIGAVTASIYDPYFKNADSSTYQGLEKAPPAVIIRPTQFPNDEPHGVGMDKAVYVNQSIPELLAIAYRIEPWRMILPDGVSAERYDYLSTLPEGQNVAALRKAVQRDFGLVGNRRADHESEVYLLKVRDSAKLQSHRNLGGAPRKYSIWDDRLNREFYFNEPISDNGGKQQNVRYLLECVLRKPIIDRTETKDGYTILLEWPREDHFEEIKQEEKLAAITRPAR